MFQSAIPLFLRCESPLHAGTGAVLGLVDLPIQRERHTGFPKVEASGLKGSLREAFDTLVPKGTVTKDDINLLFGPEEGDLHAGAVGFSDARLLLFPVRSMRGVFAWATCPKVLTRLAEDLKLCKADLPGITFGTECMVCDETDLLVGDKVVLEEYALSAVKSPPDISALAVWLAGKVFPGDEYWGKQLKKNLIVLSDDDFSSFVDLYTEIITRNRIDPKTGTVAEGALFTEEYLPAESVLYALALFSPVFAEQKGNFAGGAGSVRTFFSGKLPVHFQLGGNATLGKGIIRIASK